MIYVLAALTSFVYIFLKAFQQRNVAFEHYWLMLPLSLFMGLAEVFIIQSVSLSHTHGIILGLSLGLGGGTGSILATLTHKKIMRK